MNGFIKYYIGNSRNLEKIFRHRKIPRPTLIISSPPYYDLLDYDGMEGQIGFGQSDYDGYLIDVANVFQHCYELAEDNATFWLIIDTVKKRGEITPLPFDIHKILKEKFIQKGIIRKGKHQATFGTIELRSEGGEMANKTTFAQFHFL